MLDTLKIKQYFKKFVKNLSTYRNNNLHNALIDYIIDTYLDDSYNDIPLNHKIAYEDQVIPEEWYDIILLSNGFTSEIVSSLATSEKFILLEMFLDFNRYKGSVDQMSDVAYAFEDRLNLYEFLLDHRKKDIIGHNFTFYNGKCYTTCHNKVIFDSLDIGDYIYDSSHGEDYKIKIIDKQIVDFGNYTASMDFLSERNLNDSFKIYPNLNDCFNTELQLNYSDRDIESYQYFKLNTDDGKEYRLITETPWIGSTIITNFVVLESWYFVPYNIYSHPDLTNNIINTEFKYEVIYPKAKSFFITKDYLNEEYYNSNLILPIKTNLVLLDYGFKLDSSPINNLYSSIFFNEYKNERLIIYFKDGDYSTSLKKLYQLWYYILYKYTNLDIKNNLNVGDYYNIFDYDNFPYSINDISSLQNIYSNLKTTVDVSEFYKEYYHDKFNKQVTSDYLIENENLTVFFKSIIGNELIDYVDNRILNSSNVKLEVNFILNELYNSIITWSILYNDTLVSNNLKYFTNTLSRNVYDITDLATYKIIDFFKPYHTELIDFFHDNIIASDKFNMVNAKHSFNSVLHLLLASIAEYNDYYKIGLTTQANSNQNIIIARQLIVKHIVENELDLINHLFTFVTTLIYEQIVLIHDENEVFVGVWLQFFDTLNAVTEYIFSIWSIDNNIDINDNYEFIQQIYRFYREYYVMDANQPNITITVGTPIQYKGRLIDESGNYITNETGDYLSVDQLQGLEFTTESNPADTSYIIDDNFNYISGNGRKLISKSFNDVCSVLSINEFGEYIEKSTIICNKNLFNIYHFYFNLVNHTIFLNEALFNPFNITIQTTLPNELFKLELINIGDYNGIIDWGDGNIIQFISYNDSVLEHEYIDAGNYNIQIKNSTIGTVYASSIHKDKIISINNWGDIRFLDFENTFNNCSLIINSVDIPNFENVTSMNNGFSNNSNIISLDQKLLEKCYNVVSFNSTFYNCVITEIPIGLLDNCTSVETFNNTFDTNQITYIPSELFYNCQNVTHFIGTFQNNQIVNVPVGIFNFCSNVVDYDNVFYNNNLNQESVDNILRSILVSGATTISGKIGLNGGTNSTPSALGLINKTVLETRGWTVYIN